MHWDETKADPNPNGGSVIDQSGNVVPGANRQSGSTGPGGNGVPGSQSNPNGTYQGNVPTQSAAQTAAGYASPGLGGNPAGNAVAANPTMAPVGAAPPSPIRNPAPVSGSSSRPEGGFPGAQQILGGYQFDPDDPAKAFRNALRQLGVPTSFLAAGANSSVGKYLMNRSSQAYYQFLLDQAMSGGNLNAGAFSPYLSNFLQNGLNPTTDMGGRLSYLNQLQGRLPSDIANFSNSAFSSPAEAALAAILMTQSPSDLVDLMLGQYGGAVSPGLIGSALRPLAQQQATGFEDLGSELTGGKLFGTLKNFFLGR